MRRMGCDIRSFSMLRTQVCYDAVQQAAALLHSQHIDRQSYQDRSISRSRVHEGCHKLYEHARTTCLCFGAVMMPGGLLTAITNSSSYSTCGHGAW